MMVFITEEKDRMKKGTYQILMMSPESLFGEHWRPTLTSDLYRERVKILAIDETHLVVEW